MKEQIIFITTIIISTLLWKKYKDTLYNILKPKSESVPILDYQKIIINKMASNLLSLYHCCISMAFCLFCLFCPNWIFTPKLLFIVSCGYYLYDISNYIKFTPDFKITSHTFILHHIISIITLLFLLEPSDIDKRNFMFGFLLAELSNVPLYLCYYLKKLYEYRKTENISLEILTHYKFLIDELTLVELIFYIIFRTILPIPLFFTTESYILLFCIIFVYIGSLHWTYGMYVQINKIKTIL